MITDLPSTIKPGRLLVRFIVSLLFSFTILFLLLRPIRWQDLLALQHQLDWKWVVVGALTYWAEVTLVGIRAAILLSTYGVQPGIIVLLVSNLHNFINKITPARMGELSFPILLRRYAQVSYKKALAALIVARLADFYTVFFVAPISLILFREAREWSYRNWPWLFTIVGFASLVVIMFTKYAYPITDYVEQFSLALKCRKLSFLLNLWRDLCSLIDSSIRKRLLPVGIYSLFIWLLLYCTFVALGKAMNIGIPSRYFLVSGTLAILGTMIPINGMGHFGGLEAGWVLGLMLVGTTYVSAVTSAVGISLLVTLFALLIAVASLCVLEIAPRHFKTLLSTGKPYELLTDEE